METLQDTMGIQGRVRVVVTEAGTKRVKRVLPWSGNVITTVGKAKLIEGLVSLNYRNVTYGEIGTGSTTPTAADTTLTTATDRVELAYGTQGSSSNIGKMQFYFSDSQLANGTYREFGAYIGGTGTISSGTLLNHVLFGTAYTKASGEDTTVEIEITYT